MTQGLALVLFGFLIKPTDFIVQIWMVEIITVYLFMPTFFLLSANITYLPSLKKAVLE